MKYRLFLSVLIYNNKTKGNIMGSINTTENISDFTHSTGFKTITIDTDFDPSIHTNGSSSVSVEQYNGAALVPGYYPASDASATVSGPDDDGNVTVIFQATAQGLFRINVSASWSDAGGQGDPIIKTFDGDKYSL